MSFHLLELRVPGTDECYQAGDVMRDKMLYAFNDFVILGFDHKGLCKVSRPYAYVSSVGTTGPEVLLGYETMDVGLSWLRLATRVGRGRVT